MHNACLLERESALWPAVQSPVIALNEDAYIEKLLRHLLQRHGYQVVPISRQDSRALWQLDGDPPNLLITNAPADFLAFADDIPLIYLSASPDLNLASRFRRCRVFKKPFRNEELLAAVRDLAATPVGC